MADRSADADPQETREWLEALESVLGTDGDERAHYLIERLIDKARHSGLNLPYSATTAYANTIPVIARLLIRDFVLAFEVASVLLLAAVIGALALIRER